jgi:leucyl aminopeptidase
VPRRARAARRAWARSESSPKRPIARARRGVEGAALDGAADATIALAELPVKQRDLRMEGRAGRHCSHGGHVSLRPAEEQAPGAKRVLKKISDPGGRQGGCSPAPKPRPIARSRSPKASRSRRTSATCPGNVCTPTYLAEQAQELGKRSGIKVEILEQKDMERLGMGCFLAVARGSRQPPKFIVLEYNGGKRDAPRWRSSARASRSTTGGISIKPSARWTR